MRYRVRFVALAFASFVLSFLGSFFTSGAFPHRLLATALCSLLSFQSNACLASLPNGSERAVAADAPLSSSPAHSTPAEKVAVCLPFVGCVNTPAPPVIEKPLENVARQEVYKTLRGVIKAEIPISGTEHKFYDKVDQLPGKPFTTPITLNLASLDDTRVIPPGDYEIPAHFYCTRVYTLNGSGNRYTLAKLDGKMAEVLSALYQRASKAKTPVEDVQVLSWSIQAGVPYSDLPQNSKALVDQLIPEYRGKMDVSFHEKVLKTWNQISSQTHLPSFNQALGELGPFGEVMQSLVKARDEIIHTSFGYRPLANAFVTQQDTNPAGGIESTPWSKVDERVYMRFLAPQGALHDGFIQARIVDKTASNDKTKSFENSQLLSAKPSSPANGGVSASSLRQVVTSAVGIAIAAGSQAITATLSPSTNLCAAFRSIRKYRDRTDWTDLRTYLSYVTGALGFNDVAELTTGLLAGNIVDCPEASGYDLSEIENVATGLAIAATMAAEQGSISAACTVLEHRGLADRPKRPHSASKKQIAVYAAEATLYGACSKIARLPQGLTQKQFSSLSNLLREKAGHISDDIRVHGSRASGTAKPTSDIDVAIRVSEQRFNQLIQERFGKPNPGSAKERTMLNAINTGKIQSGEAGLSSLRNQIEQELGMKADVSIILEGGKFDNGPWIPIE